MHTGKEHFMETLYFLFEQIPNPQSGGLITMYRGLENLLADTYNIKIISVFDCPDDFKKQFHSECMVINKTDIDNRFLLVTKHIKERQFRKSVKCIISMIKYFLYIPVTRRKLAHLIKESDHTLVSSPAAAIFMTGQRKFILEVHSKYEFFWEGSLSSKLQVKLMTQPNLILFRNKSDALKGSRYYNSDYIYNFFDNSDIKRKDVFDQDTNRFLFIGRFNEDKNPLRLLKNIEMLINKDVNVQLDMYGQGPLESDIVQYIKDHHLEEHVFVKGFTNDKNIYSAYTALLMTSRREGFPLTVIEAKANGVPTITTKWGDAVYETVTDGVDGFIVENDAEFCQRICELMNDPETIQRFCQNAYHDFDRFTKGKAKKRYIHYIETL